MAESKKMASSVVEKRALGFSDLPGEVRNMIYWPLLTSPLEDLSDLAAPSATSSSSNPSSTSAPTSDQSSAETNTNNDTITASSDKAKDRTLKTKESKPPHLCPAILATSSAINAEATLLLYTHNTFTATITAASVLTPHAPALFPSEHRLIRHTRSWTIVIDLVASTPDSWGLTEWDWQETVDDGRDVLDGIKTRVRHVCRALEHLACLEKVTIRVVSDYPWQLRSRYAGLGMVRLLGEFKTVRAGKVKIEGAGALVRQRSVVNVRKAMLGAVDVSAVEVFADSWA